MRTTLNVADDVLRAVRSLAASEGRSLGDVLSELARRGLRPRPSAKEDAGFPVFDVADDAPPLTPDLVACALEEDPGDV